MHVYKEKYTVIFLVDEEKPSKFVLLKRGADRKFAPNMYTGIGGKIEIGESPSEGAGRELGEETPDFTNIELTEFGRLTVNEDKILHYFFGITNTESLPHCSEGTLEWVTIKELFDKDIIPTTKFFLEEWQKRDWNTKQPFTVYLKRDNPNDIYSMTTSINVHEGLN